MVPEKAIQNWCLLTSGSPCMVKLVQNLEFIFSTLFFTAGIQNLKIQQMSTSTLLSHISHNLHCQIYKECFQIICTLCIWHVLRIVYAVYSWTSRTADIETTNWRNCGRAIASGVSGVDLWLKMFDLDPVCFSKCFGIWGCA